MDDLSDFHTVKLSDVTDSEVRRRLMAEINLMENTYRGLVGEVLVAIALKGAVTDGWGAWDVTLEDGTRVEVKTTGPIQAWPQGKPSAPIWGIARSKGWVLTDGVYVVDPTLERRSDLYVFALHTGTHPDDVTEWRFHVVWTEAIDRELDDQKTITESSLIRRFSSALLTYDELVRHDLDWRISAHMRYLAPGTAPSSGSSREPISMSNS